MPGARPSAGAVYVISVAAELAGVHPQTLRIYERKGLLDPITDAGRVPPVQRSSTWPGCARIHELTSAGLNLEGVRRVLELEAEVRRLACPARRRSAGRPGRPLERTHRHYRRDLVPLNQSPVPYRGPARARTANETRRG